MAGKKRGHRCRYIFVQRMSDDLQSMEVVDQICELCRRLKPGPKKRFTVSMYGDSIIGEGGDIEDGKHGIEGVG